MFAVGDPEEGLPEPVFYTDGRRASELGPVTLPRRLVYVAGPLWDVATNPQEAKSALDAAQTAWNLTRIAEPLRTELLGKVIQDIVQRTGDASDFSDMIMRAMRWPRDPHIVADLPFKELAPGQWHVAVLSLTPAEISRRTSSRAAKPRAPRRG